MDVVENGKEQKRLPICASDFGQTKELGQFRAHMHVGVLAEADHHVKLELAEEEHWPVSADFEIYRCALQLEVGLDWT